MKQVKVIFTDCDGVLTDGGVYYDDNGKITRKFNTLDGHAVNIARTWGIDIVIVTAQSILNGDSIQQRADDLGIPVIYNADKGYAVQNYLKTEGIEKAESVFIGNDITDLEALPYTELFVCPADAHRRVYKQADSATSARGGEGVLREVIEDVVKYFPSNPS